MIIPWSLPSAFFKNKTTPLHHITAAWVQPKHWWNHPSLAFDPCNPSPAKRPNPAAEPAMKRQSKKMFFGENASILTNTKNQKTNPQNHLKINFARCLNSIQIHPSQMVFEMFCVFFPTDLWEPQLCHRLLGQKEIQHGIKTNFVHLLSLRRNAKEWRVAFGEKDDIQLLAFSGGIHKMLVNMYYHCKLCVCEKYFFTYL